MNSKIFRMDHRAFHFALGLISKKILERVFYFSFRPIRLNPKRSLILGEENWFPLVTITFYYFYDLHMLYLFTSEPYMHLPRDRSFFL